MPSYIIKMTRGEESRYLEWSTIVDAPVTRGMTLERFMGWYRFQFGEQGMRDLPERMARVEATGISAFNYPLKELLSWNRSGPNETSLTPDEIWDRYCVGED